MVPQTDIQEEKKKRKKIKREGDNVSKSGNKNKKTRKKYNS